MKKRCFFLFIFVVLAVLIPYWGVFSACYAANHYIRPEATGENTGTDWMNAWTEHPDVWVRGDTYYYADGLIDSECVISAKEIGDSRIILKKATVEDHGTDIGWNNTYGDGVFVFTQGKPEKNSSVVSVRNSYVTIDGQTGGGPGHWRDGFGFRVSLEDSTDVDNHALIRIYDGASYTDFSHIDMKQAGILNWEPVENGYLNKQDCFYCSSSDGFSHINIRYCYLHDSNRVSVLWGYVSDSIIEYSCFERRQGEPHGEAISANNAGLNANNIFRYNLFVDISGTGIIVIKDSVQSHYYIYGNVFMSTDRDFYYTTNGVICDTGGDKNTYMSVYNNTMINLGGGNTGVSWRGIDISGNIVVNNLWYNCKNVGVSGIVSGGYNEYRDCNFKYSLKPKATDTVSSGNPFEKSLDALIDDTNPTFDRQSESVTGKILEEPFNSDMNEFIRGADGIWTRGAIEFQSSLPGRPTISSVTISPISGIVTMRDGVLTYQKLLITVTAGNKEIGLTASDALINGKYIRLSDQGDGTYKGIYDISSDDNHTEFVYAQNITLRDAEGNISIPALSPVFSLYVNTEELGISSIDVTPESGYVKIGESINITVMAENNETNLIASDVVLNGKQISLLNQNDGSYSGIYTVTESDNDLSNVLISNIKLFSADTVRPYVSYFAQDVIIDANIPTIQSITLTPDTGTIYIGDKVIITVTAGNNESGLICSDTLLNGKNISLFDQGDGTYVGVYTVETGDNEAVNIKTKEITLTDRAGNVSEPASIGSTIEVKPVVVSVESSDVYEFSLSQNYPNPFNMNTTIEFQIPGYDGEINSSNAELFIYNIYGQRIRKYIFSNRFTGKNSIIWDGRDDNGQIIATGRYFYQINYGKYKATKTLIFLK
ncbi:MAG: hypothetical protein JXB48_05770 [Candidatus Latescibacteria bacterium]|nr:hypothetical protein [Candidatus Latescibacterota bacterium]